MACSHNFGAKQITFNSSINRSLLVAITLMNCGMSLTLGIEI